MLISRYRTTNTLDSRRAQLACSEKRQVLVKTQLQKMQKLPLVFWQRDLFHIGKRVCAGKLVADFYLHIYKSTVSKSKNSDTSWIYEIRENRESPQFTALCTLNIIIDNCQYIKLPYWRVWRVQQKIANISKSGFSKRIVFLYIMQYIILLKLEGHIFPTVQHRETAILSKYSVIKQTQTSLRISYFDTSLSLTTSTRFWGCL